MENCEKYSKLLCSECEHYDYCDIAKRCDGICYSCDITECENNPDYKEDTKWNLLFPTSKN